MAEESSDMCWICLEEASENGSHKLMSPCKCPRKVHPQCLARWQLQQAGRHEEKFCRFCNAELADWKLHLTPEELKPEVSKVQPIMVVYFEGQIHRIPVKQGPDGLDEFTGKIRELFRLPEDVDISLTFGCKEPMSGTHLKLEGMGAFDAAVHCASVAAAERQQKIKKSHSTGNLGSHIAANNTAAGSNGGSGRNVNRSASSTQISASSVVSHATAASPPPLAAGSPTAPAVAGRRQRFHGQQQQQQQPTGGQVHPPWSHRSRSLSHITTGSGGYGSNSSGAALQQPARGAIAEPPAAFRNILGMLAGSVAPATSGGPAGAAAAAAGSGGGSTAASGQATEDGSGGGAPGRSASMRLKSNRCSLRNITELRDVPEMDETVAVGSLSGKFKLHLKAFSRKVARGLSFSRANGSSSSLASQVVTEDREASFSASSSSSSSPAPHAGSFVQA